MMNVLQISLFNAPQGKWGASSEMAATFPKAVALQAGALYASAATLPHASPGMQAGAARRGWGGRHGAVSIWVSSCRPFSTVIRLTPHHSTSFWIEELVQVSGLCSVFTTHGS